MSGPIKKIVYVVFLVFKSRFNLDSIDFVVAVLCFLVLTVRMGLLYLCRERDKFAFNIH